MAQELSLNAPRECPDTIRYQDIAQDPPNSFSYNWGSPAKTFKRREKRKVSAVEFPKSRFADFRQTITFETPVSVGEAVDAAELYLSAPIDEKYYEQVVSDLSNPKLSYVDACKEFSTRGDLIGCANNLDDLELEELREEHDSNGKRKAGDSYKLSLVTGS
jgi:hypothetical protein